MTVQTKVLSNTESFKSQLKRHDLKATAQRLAVNDAMMELGHASADMVAERIQEKNEVKVSVASVYNILSQLALLGIYHYRLSANNKMYFDVNPVKHIHLYDTTNHEFRDVFDDEIMDMVESKIKNRRFRGYKTDGVEILILCHPSRKTSSK